MRMVAFHDLNLLHDTSERQMKRAFASAAKLGFDVVAVGHVATALDKTVQSPAPPAIDWNEQSSGNSKSTKLKQLSRLTVVLSEAGQANKLRSENIQSYDILAVQPTTEKMFHMACTSMEVDVISITMTERAPFYFKTQPVKVALERGIHFEIPYAPAIAGDTVRRYVISNAMNLVRVARGRNIIISSMTNKPLELRGPHDVANLGILFGMSEHQAKDTVQSNCRAVIMHAATRKSIRSSMDMHKISQLAAGDQWKVKASQQASGLAEESSTQGPTSKKKQKKKRNREDRKHADNTAKKQRLLY